MQIITYLLLCTLPEVDGAPVGVYVAVLNILMCMHWVKPSFVGIIQLGTPLVRVQLRTPLVQLRTPLVLVKDFRANCAWYLLRSSEHFGTC